MNARFWIWHRESFVKLTVPHDGEINLSDGYRTEEGYHSEHERYWIEDGFLMRESDSYDQDCDGPLERFCTCCCPLGDLQVREPHEDLPGGEGVLLPEWQRVSASQRDHWAELAGY